MSRTLRDELASLSIDRLDHKPRRRRGFGLALSTALLWLIPLTLLGGAAVFGYRQYEKVRPKPKVSVALVQRMTTGEAEKLLTAKGYIKSRNQAMIGAKMPGRVEAMYVEEGTRVKKGQVLAVLEHNDLSAVLESRRAMIQKAEAELQEVRTDLAEKTRRADRARRLLAQRNIALEELDKDLSARDMAAARASALEAQIRLLKAQVRETEETVRNMHIVAPFDGTVITKEAEVGETITPGGMGAASGRGSVVTVADLDRLEVETDVNENLLYRIGPRQPAEVSVGAVPGKHYRGRVRQIIPMGDRARGTIKVKVAILDPDEHLFPELAATVNFLPDRSAQDERASQALLFVPKAAVVEENGHTYAWVVDDKQAAHKRAVDVTATDDELARVEKGLEAGETVVLSPPKGLRENEMVQVED